MQSGATVVVPAEYVNMVDRLIKTAEGVIKEFRQANERALKCRQCGEEPDYHVTYSGVVISGEEARVCEPCLNGAIIHKHGMDIYTWKQNGTIKCLRCGADVTKRGWCTCPANARRVASESRERREGGGGGA